MALQQNPSSQSRPAPRLTVLEGVGWMILGLLLGLIIGWVIWPVEWADAEPGDLRPDAKAHYVSATADAYVASGGQDPNTALLRMQSFDDPQAAVMEAIAYFRESNDPNRAIREVNLRSLASALNAQLYATAPPTPRAVGREITWPNWIVGILTGILLVVGGVWAWRRWQAAQAATPATPQAAGPGSGSWVNPPQSPPTSPPTSPATSPPASQPTSASPDAGIASGPSPAVAPRGWQPVAPPERSTPQAGRPPIKFETFDSLADAPGAGSQGRAAPGAGEDGEDDIGDASGDAEDTGEIQRISPVRSVADSQTRESRSAQLADDAEDSFEADFEDDFEDDIEGDIEGDFEDYNGFVDYAAGVDEDEDAADDLEDEDDGEADDGWEVVDIAPPVRRLSPLFDDEDADADTESDTEEADDGPNWLGNWQPRAPGERTEPGNGPSLESPVESGKSADNDQASEDPADDPEEEEEPGILPTVEGVLNAWRRPKNEKESQPVRGGPELGTFTAEYNAGILAYEQSFTVTSNGKDDGTPLGACGMGVNEKLDKSASHTNRVHVLDVWLYDGEDVRSASQILVSPGVDVESLGQEAESAGTITGEPLEIAAGLTFRIPTRNLLLDCRVVNAEFLDTDSRPRPLRSARVEMKVRSVK